MKLLFLDIDGVLNSRETITNAKKVITTDRTKWWLDMLDSTMVARLNTVVERTGCMIVVSSTWRISLNRHELLSLLMQKGFTGSILSCTPSKTTNEECRGDEIQAWLDDNPFREVQTFAIVDDNSDMGHLKDRLVKTDFATGMLDAHVERLVRFLNEND